MVAPSTSATMPVPTPTMTPQSATSSHISVIAIEATTPATIIATAETTTGRTPKRLLTAAAKRASPEGCNKGGAEGRAPPNQSEPHRERHRDIGRAPAELFLERLYDDA